ncbi:uncharacterized protein LOC130444531 [Diorhabda sublineata]|uniref:uncharacterized protein LOC130444531 n=1 Tax=Diorhabda sublineata TaxID=1163346 RepID=UPI0024E18480|nr:uncharacterized protein LOC130444531 [Diorhabda sublineata]
MVKLLHYISVVSLITFACCISAEQHPKPPKMAECLNEIGITEDKVFDKNFEDRKVSCFWKCIMEKNGLVTSDGVVNPDKLENSFPEDAPKFPADVVSEMKTCLGTVGKINSCDDVQKIRQCIE